MSSEAKSNAQIAVKSLREMIFDGRLQPGSNHFEQDLADRLGMSRTPLREAALTLEAQGLVEVIPRRGVRIKDLSPARMAEIYDVLSVLESHAVERVAHRVAEGELDVAALAILRESIDQMHRALERDDRAQWALADDVFHSELVRLSGNSHLEDTVARTVDQVRRARILTLHLRPIPTSSTKDHTTVLEAISKGDGARAHREHLAHRQAAKTMLVKLLVQIGGETR